MCKFFFLVFVCSLISCSESTVESIQKTNGLVSYWDFAEEEGRSKCSKGRFYTHLYENGDEPIPVINEGPLSGKSIQLNGRSYLSIPYNETGELNIKTNEVTVVAWVKWTGEQTGFVGGMWDEYGDGGKRQYGLFISLPHYNGKDQVCGHISKTGKPTPQFPYSIDYSASKQLVPHNKWVTVGFTYDGEFIRSYLNGKFEMREVEVIRNTKGITRNSDGILQRKNPYYYPDGLGVNGSDFTVGAVMVKGKMGNFFKGQIGGLAIFDRALTEKEMSKFKVN